MDAAILDTPPPAKGGLPELAAPNLGAARYRLTLRAETPIRLPVYAGSAMRSSARSV